MTSNGLKRKNVIESSGDEESKRPKKETPIKINIFTSKGHLQVQLPESDEVIRLTENDGAIGRYENDRLRQLRERLNDAKSKLDRYHNTNDRRVTWAWNKFNYITDVYRPMRFEIERQFNGHIVTNAWMKYYEIIRQYGLVDTTVPRDLPYRAFFNAELPGAALCAFNHYMKTRNAGLQFQWWASSLAPSEADLESGTNNTCLGDQYGLYECNKANWLMTKDNNGDMTVLENVIDFERRIGPRSSVGGVDFYSHDAGIDVSEGEDGKLGFNNQEMANARIHLGCALAGFVTLKKGGAFVAKQYTFFETLTWNLLIIYASLFKEFSICKPLTSRARNSEIYLVGKGFKGLPDSVRHVLAERLEHFHAGPLFSEEQVKQDFGKTVQRIEECATKVFDKQQIPCIKQLVEQFEIHKMDNMRSVEEDVEAEKKKCAEVWLRNYEIMKLVAENDKLPCFEKKRY